MERRRELALRRREQNLEHRGHLEGIKQTQGLTRPGVFSYYVLWPQDTYERLIGGEPKKKRGFGTKKAKKPKA